MLIDEVRLYGGEYYDWESFTPAARNLRTTGVRAKDTCGYPSLRSQPFQDVCSLAAVRFAGWKSSPVK
jgi:hypothetical protein